MSLHDDEVVSTPELVHRLVGEQFPRWAHLPVTSGPAGGTDHHLFRLGEFVAALRTVSIEGAPVKDGTSRGVPLVRLDDDVRAAIAASGDRIDGPAATKAWERGRGWVLVQAVIALPYYWDRWPEFALACQARVASVLEG